MRAVVAFLVITILLTGCGSPGTAATAPQLERMRFVRLDRQNSNSAAPIYESPTTNSRLVTQVPGNTIFLIGEVVVSQDGSRWVEASYANQNGWLEGKYISLLAEGPAGDIPLPTPRTAPAAPTPVPAVATPRPLPTAASIAPTPQPILAPAVRITAAPPAPTATALPQPATFSNSLSTDAIKRQLVGEWTLAHPGCWNVNKGDLDITVIEFFPNGAGKMARVLPITYSFPRPDQFNRMELALGLSSTFFVKFDDRGRLFLTFQTSGNTCDYLRS